MQSQIRIVAAFAVGAMMSACQTASVSFQNATLPGVKEPTRTIGATIAKPDGAGPFPAVVLLHTCGGVQPHVSNDWPRYLTSLGYVTVTVNSFGSRGLGGCPNGLHPAGSGPQMQVALSNAYREIGRDAFGALDYLATLPHVAADRVAVIGYSLGANVINSFLVHYPQRPEHNFAAAIGLYGRCHDLSRYPTPRTPLMEIAGELDERHVDSCRAVASKVEVHVLPGAYHSWDSPQASGKPEAYGSIMYYSAAATNRSRELVRDFLARHLNPK